MVISKVKWFYLEVLKYKKHFLDKKQYEDFVLELASILTNGLFSDYKKLYEGKTYKDLIKIN